MKVQLVTLNSSDEVTFTSSHCWEYTKMGLTSGFGIMISCTDIPGVARESYTSDGPCPDSSKSPQKRNRPWNRPY